MEALLEAIFGNFMIILIIIGGIIGFVKDKLEKEKHSRQQTEKSNKKPYTASAPPTGDHQTNKQAKPLRQLKPRPESKTVSTEEQREEQLKRLTGNINMRTKEALEDFQHSAMKKNTEEKLDSKPKKSQLQHKPMKERMKRNLSRDGLVDSIIMSEVLDSPRLLGHIKVLFNPEK
ncbi:hypothetical protein [Virgibacillus alimentarius]|uniref:hypothetical protein n=1 Tax=Virgibacillus alimentarius TaxID=698769 RepID=UPI00049308D0|nr:hypothetical protein [Virgibacillus alimentarius]